MDSSPFFHPNDNWSKHLVQDSQPEGIVTDDELFIRKIFEQDPKAGCALLYRRYYVNLCNHVIRFVYSKELAQDIVSEVFCQFWQQRQYEHITSSFRAYLYKAVRSRAYNHLKRHLNRTSSLDHTDILSVQEAIKPDETLFYHELYQKIEAIIKNLPPQCKRAFLLHRIEGKKYAEIAQELQITSSAVERLISRALAKLFTQLKQEGFISLLLLLLVGQSLHIHLLHLCFSA
jgi:RNA polymerase sigma-70 factor (ECF subfamily)